MLNEKKQELLEKIKSWILILLDVRQCVPASCFLSTLTISSLAVFMEPALCSTTYSRRCKWAHSAIVLKSR